MHIQYRAQKCGVSEDEGSSIQGDTSDSSSKLNKTKSILVVPTKRKKVTTQAEALGQLSTGLENLGESQNKRMEMWLLAEQKWEEAHLKYQERQSELNRQHELHMIQLLASFQNAGNTQHSNLISTMHTQHPTPIAQVSNAQQNSWSVMNVQAFTPTSSVSYHHKNMDTVGEEAVYTNLDNYNC